MTEKEKTFRDEVHANAVEKGFWDTPDFDTFLMLIVSEIGEAIEADRKDRDAEREVYEATIGIYENGEPGDYTALKEIAFKQYVKDSIGDEVADSIIRLNDFAGGYNYEISCDPFIPTGLTFIKHLKKATRSLVQMEEGDAATNEWNIATALAHLIEAAKTKDIDIEWHISEKMKYNKGREKMHGKRY